VCSKGFYLLSLTESGRTLLFERPAVMQSAFKMIKCKSARTRVNLGSAVCNMLVCPITRRGMIACGALPVLKMIATMDFQLLREAVARAIVSLAQDPTLHFQMSKEPVVSILVTVMHSSNGYTFDCALFALSCLAPSPFFQPTLMRYGVDASVAAILSGKVQSAGIAEEIFRSACAVLRVYNAEESSFSMTKHERENINQHAADGVSWAVSTWDTFLLSAQVVYKAGLCNQDCALLLVCSLSELAKQKTFRQSLLNKGGFVMLQELVSELLDKFETVSLPHMVVGFLTSMVEESDMHEELLQQGLFTLLRSLCLHNPRQTQAVTFAAAIADSGVASTERKEEEEEEEEPASDTPLIFLPPLLAKKNPSISVLQPVSWDAIEPDAEIPLAAAGDSTQTPTPQIQTGLEGAQPTPEKAIPARVRFVEMTADQVSTR
jgi:hypothetical protein